MRSPLFEVLGYLQFITWIAVVARFVAGIVLGMAVYRDALPRETRPFGIAPAVWALLVFAEPGIGLLGYVYVQRSSQNAATT